MVPAHEARKREEACHRTMRMKLAMTWGEMKLSNRSHLGADKIRRVFG